jgi:hypothetical protein
MVALGGIMRLPRVGHLVTVLGFLALGLVLCSPVMLSSLLYAVGSGGAQARVTDMQPGNMLYRATIEFTTAAGDVVSTTKSVDAAPVAILTTASGDTVPAPYWVDSSAMQTVSIRYLHFNPRWFNTIEGQGDTTLVVLLSILELALGLPVLLWWMA